MEILGSLELLTASTCAAGALKTLKTNCVEKGRTMTTKTYFDPVPDFEPEVQETVVERPKAPVFPTDFGAWLKLVNDELARIQDGTSKLRAPLYFGDRGAPVLAALSRFTATPTAEGIVTLLTLAKQDLGARVALQFKSWLLDEVQGIEPFVKDLLV